MDKKRNLNLIIRGEAFRIGGNMSRSTNGNIQEQKTAVLSIIKYVIQPLHKFYNLNIYKETMCNKNTIARSIQKIYRNICYFGKWC